MSAFVLVVDSDSQVAKLLAGILTGQGYAVRTANDVESALEGIDVRRPALIIAGLDMPGMNGVELCRRVRATSSVPIILVSGSNECRAEVAALDSGADDFVVKPFVTEKLLARVRAALRRTAKTAEEAEESALGVGEFYIDFDHRRVRVNGQPVRLTPKEFDLFVYMARHPNRVLRHRTLLGAVWGEASEEQPEYLRVFMGQLRKKLESDPSHPRYLVTEPWVGYRFNPTGLAQ